jgi:hypothetical protein
VVLYAVRRISTGVVVVNSSFDTKGICTFYVPNTSCKWIVRFAGKCSDWQKDVNERNYEMHGSELASEDGSDGVDLKEWYESERTK